MIIKFSNTAIVSIYDIDDAYDWCIQQFGHYGENWKFTLSHGGFLGMGASSFYDADQAEFLDDSSAMLFALTFSKY